ncbi:MAG: DNA polymerase I [Phycisphaerae bacterium]|nr:DNA polymerase I [Phycisphaerae bacterium]
MAKTLYIIDGHAHIYSAYFAPMRDLTSPSGEPTKATYIFTTAILGVIQNYKPDYLVVTMDSKAPTFRKDLYSEYKAQRPPMPEDMPPQISRIEQILGAMHIPVLRKDGFEADDLIGTLTRQGAARGLMCSVCSRDKDILQLINDRVCVLDIKNGIKTTIETLKESQGVTPEQFLDVLALQGDTSDNVPGVPDVGPKTALTWIRQYGSIENLYAHADEIKGKRGERLRASRDIVDLSKRLVTIDSEVPIDLDFEAMAVTPFDVPRLRGLFEELGFSRLLTQLEDQGDSPDRPAPALAPASSERHTLKTVEHCYTLVDTSEKLDDLCARLKGVDLLAVDTETTSVQPMRADLVGISLAWRKHEAYYVPVKAPLGEPCLRLAEVQAKLGPVLASEQVRKVGQNIKYDWLILTNAGLPLNGIVFDTMVASYCVASDRVSHSMDNMALDYLNYECVSITELIGKGKNQLTFDVVDTSMACEYAAEDADITWQLYHYLKPRLEALPHIAELFHTVEMPLVRVLAAMEFHGVCLDTKHLHAMSNDIARTLDDVTDEIYKYAQCVFNIDSPKQLGDILFDKLGLTSMRKGKTGRSTDAKVLEQIADQHPIVECLLQYRQLRKLQTTYVDKLGTLINARTNRLHTSFNQTVTATGRLSSSDPNLQNIPIRTPLGRQIRGAFVAEKATDCILTADYSQVELRLLAHLSQDPALIEAFAADHDIHRFVASQVFGVPLDEVTSDMRSKSKAVNFGIIYGQGAFGLSRSVGMTMGEAKKFIEDYFSRYASIQAFMDGIVAQAEERGYVETMLHRRRSIPDIHSANANRKAQARRLAVNTVVQGSAADLIKLAMIKIQQKIESEHLPIKMILQVHDELVFELNAELASEHAHWIEKAMTGAMTLSVPLKVDIGYGPTWLSGK